jgi:hypothetical protein
MSSSIDALRLPRVLVIFIAVGTEGKGKSVSDFSDGYD